MKSIGKWFIPLLMAGIGFGAGVAAYADWMSLPLPDLSQAWGATALAHLPDGRYVFGESGNLYQQDAWGAAAYSPYTSEPAGIDPSFIAVWDDGIGVVGQGGWSASSLYSFSPADTGGGFTNIGLSLQNYHGVMRDGLSLYTGGADTGPGGDHHGIRLVTLDGATNRIVIDDISTYSCGFDLDEDGNLYVGDNDDGKVYRFSAAQLSAAAQGDPLAITNGTLVHDFGDGGDIGSLAVDSSGRIWAAGWQHTGLRVYNPDLDREFTYIPGLSNANYKVACFERGGVGYVAYINQADPSSAGSSQYYGYDEASHYAVPEPAELCLILLGGGLLGGLRRRRMEA